MMKKNIVFLVLDSLSYDELQFHLKRTPQFFPFFRELSQNSLFYSSVYSQGPHSEIGVRGLICQKNVLDDGGTVHFLQDRNIFSDFIDSGYDVSYLAKPFIYVSKELRDNGNFCHYYTGVQKFKYLWRNRLEYWADVRTQRELRAYELKEISNLVEDMFETLEDFWCDAMRQSNNVILVEKPLEDIDAKAVLKAIKIERKRYNDDKNAYVLDLLVRFDENPLVVLTDIDENCHVKYPSIEYVDRKYGRYIKMAEMLQLVRNIIPEFSLAKKMIRSFRERRTSLLWLNYMLRLVCRNSFGYKEWPALDPSIRKQLDFVTNLLSSDKEKVGSRPKFVYLQPEELHYHHNFFSFDCDDKRIVDREFWNLLKYLKKASIFLARGFLSTSLAYLYVDEVLNDFWDRLGTIGARDNTILVITSDHGSSYGHSPVRDGLPFNSPYSENYHIPLLIYNGSSVKQDDSLYENIDIVSLLREALGGDRVPPRSIVHTEYMGPGYQDIINKKIIFTAQNKHWKIVYCVGVFDSFRDGKVLGIYNLEKDPNEKKPLKMKKIDGEIEELLLYLEERHFCLSKQYSKQSFDKAKK